MTAPGPARRLLVRSAVARGAGLFGLWLLLAAPLPGTAAKLFPDLAVGALGAIWATWVSLRLLPPTPTRVRWRALVRLVVHFLWQSSVAGLDAALRAFHPRLPLHPGFLAYRVGLAPGTGRSAFGAFTSLMPGTLPVGTGADDALIYHCLDLDKPIAAGLTRDERLFVSVRGPAADHD